MKHIRQIAWRTASLMERHQQALWQAALQRADPRLQTGQRSALWVK